MKKIVFVILAFLVIGMNTTAQTGEKLKKEKPVHDSMIYDQNGQYIQEDFLDLRNSNNTFESSVYYLVGNGTDKNFYPRFSIEGVSIYGSGLGIVAFIDYSQAVVYNDWREKGYNIHDTYNLGVNLAISYTLPKCNSDVKFFAGWGIRSVKSFQGPFLGFEIEDKNCYFKVRGCYPVVVAYKSSYSEEDLKRFGPKPIIADGFDPNGWYKIVFGCHLNPRLDIGLVAERFYISGFFSEYNLGIKPWRSLRSLKIKGIAGQNIEKLKPAQNCFSLGVVMDIK